MPGFAFSANARKVGAAVMYKILASVLFIVCLSAGTSSSKSSAEPGARQQNGCVKCHSRLSAPGEISDSFLDWRTSRHAFAGVTCDKCHGGDPMALDRAKAHRGVLPPSNPDSRLYRAKSPDTCVSCHVAVVRSFVESKHYLQLKANESAPSCISCHGHMTSRVARAPADGNSLCTFCHNTVEGPSQRPDIVRNAKFTLDAIARTNYMVAWIEELLDQGRKKKLNVNAEEEALSRLKIMLGEAKAGWHAFTLETPAAKAGKSFDEAVRIKDSLARKLGLD